MPQTQIHPLMTKAAPPLILASASLTRRHMLTSAGLAFEVLPARVDEDEIKASLKAAGKSADDIATTLAELKALNVSSKLTGAFVIGADQVLSCGSELFDKPQTRDAARTQLKKLRGKEHVLHSAICVARDDAVLMHKIDRAKVTMRELSDSFLEDYLDVVGTKAFSSVGAYQLEGLGAQLFSRLQGDYFTILGLPLLPLLDFLRNHNIIPR